MSYGHSPIWSFKLTTNLLLKLLEENAHIHSSFGVKDADLKPENKNEYDLNIAEKIMPAF